MLVTILKGTQSVKRGTQHVEKKEHNLLTRNNLLPRKTQQVYKEEHNLLPSRNTTCYQEGKHVTKMEQDKKGTKMYTHSVTKKEQNQLPR